MKGLYPERKLSDSSIGQQIAADLRMRIISNDMEDKTTLSENKLSDEYNVSRSPIREALQILNNEGLVTLRRMGAKVVGISEKDIDEIYDIRLMLESFVFNNFLLKREDNSQLVKALNKTLEMMKVSIKYKDPDEFSFKDVEFHETIIHSINHRYMNMLWSNLKPVIECFILLDMRHRMEADYEDFERVIKNHELLIQAIEQLDKNIVDEAFYYNFRDVKKNSDDLWGSPELLKKASEYRGE